MKKQYHTQEKEARIQIATFAGGCFWCIEAAFVIMPGIISVTSGYAGGNEKNPNYEEVASGETSHREAVQITFDSKKNSYEELLGLFWRQIDPTDPQGQFADRGNQYKTAIFYHSLDQKRVAEASKEKLQKKFQTIATQILPFTSFYPAEEYHQQFYKKNPLRYNAYKLGSGRMQKLREIWES